MNYFSCKFQFGDKVVFQVGGTDGANYGYKEGLFIRKIQGKIDLNLIVTIEGIFFDLSNTELYSTLLLALEANLRQAKELYKGAMSISKITAEQAEITYKSNSAELQEIANKVGLELA